MVVHPRTCVLLVASLGCLAAVLARTYLGVEPWINMSSEFDAGLAAATVIWALTFLLVDLLESRG